MKRVVEKEKEKEGRGTRYDMKAVGKGAPTSKAPTPATESPDRKAESTDHDYVAEFRDIKRQRAAAYLVCGRGKQPG